MSASAEDGQGGTSDSTSGEATLANTPPVKGSVAITPSSPAVRATVTAMPTGFVDADGDALSYRYRSSLNGMPVPGATEATFALSGAARSDMVSAEDGQGGTTAESVSDPVMVANMAPVKGTVSISPASPTTDTMMGATETGSRILTAIR